MKPARLLGLAAGLFLVACDQQPLAPNSREPAGPSAMLVGSGGAFTEVSAGTNHSCAIRSDGSLVCWGYENSGQVSGPTTAGTGFTQVSAGHLHTCARKLDGSVTCWGYDGHGQVSGTPTTTAPYSATYTHSGPYMQVSASYRYHTCAVKTDGSLDCWGYDAYGQASPPGGSFTQVSAGYNHSCALKSDGSIICWGYNNVGQVSGTPETLAPYTATYTHVGPFTQVSAGGGHSCGVKTDGSILCWGNDWYGQVGGTPSGADFLQVGAGSVNSCALKSDGSLVCWGYDGFGQVSNTPAGTDFVQLDVGYLHACALKSDNSAVCWGEDAFGKVSDVPTGGTTILPTASFTAPASVDEGDDLALSLEDAQVPGYSGPVAFTYAFDCGDGSFTPFSSTTATTCTTATDDGSLTVKGTVRDQDGDSQGYSATVTVANVAPAIGTISAPIDPVAVGTAVNIGVDFSDPGLIDAPWSYSIDWGDGATPSTGIVTTQGADAVTGTHTYQAAGVYPVAVTVTDKDGGAGTETHEYVVVYDPSAGFATGGGWFDSPAGSYLPDASLSGKATFGFVSRYRKGANVPTGSTEFQFRAAGMNFHSDVQDWLVVNQGGTNAQFKGAGTINGGGSYRFMIWAGDGSPDTFRIRIWEEIGGAESTVYDNGVAQPISGGSITIHAK